MSKQNLKKNLTLGIGIILFLLIICGVLTGSFLGQFTSTLGIPKGKFLSIIAGSTSHIRFIEGRINFLILGIGGPTHEGGDLTDTMLLVSYNPTANSLSTISIPRDIWSETLKDKINSAYHYGEESEPGGGITLTKMIVDETTGIQASYVFVIDFSGFENLIDELGGIDIEVARPFTDTTYPIAGKENDPCDGDMTFSCRYMTITFEKGKQHMDGSRALMYVRSRHADGEEGTDFARGDRQQQVIVAIQDKLMTAKTYFPPAKVLTLITLFKRMMNSDMSIEEQLSFVRQYGIGLRKADVQKISLEDQLQNPDASLYDGRYVLVPKTDWNEVIEYIHKKLQEEL